MGWSAAVGIAPDAAERGELERRARRRKTSRGDALRAEIVLLAGGGLPGGWWRGRARRRNTSRGDALRAEIVLLAADSMTDVAVAERLGAGRLTVATWR